MECSPRYIPSSAVTQTGNSPGLLLGATAYPNPMASEGALDVTLSEPASIAVAGYDIAGQEVLRLSDRGNLGINEIDLSSQLQHVHGAVLLRVSARSGNAEETRNVMLLRP